MFFCVSQLQLGQVLVWFFKKTCRESFRESSPKLGPDRDNRFARVKLENFDNIGLFQEQFNREIGLCTEAPDENYRRTALINSISGLPQIKFEMEKVLKTNAEVTYFELMQALKSCEVLMPKKQPATAAAVSTSSTEED